MQFTSTLKNLGFRFPAEWEPHEATWLSWPHNEETWPGHLQEIYPPYLQFIQAIAEGEEVCINVNDAKQRDFVERMIEEAGIQRVRYFLHPTNDAWCRDHGPIFLTRSAHPQKIVVNWDFNAWGGKYPPYHLDNQIPERIALARSLPYFTPGRVLEGGSVEFNGAGAVLTTKSCLLNPNRNPELNQQQIEHLLQESFGIDQVLWLESGIIGDDTDGHIDDLARFLNEDTVVAPVAQRRSHPDYLILKENKECLESMRLLNGKPLNVVELPVPAPYEEDGFFFPCSYANFYICNAAVLVPTFEDPQDEVALEVLSSLMRDRKVVGIPSRGLIRGLGSLHCLSQQEPKL